MNAPKSPYSPASTVETTGGAPLAVAVDWLLVIWRPWAVLARSRSGADVAILIFTLLAVDFVLMLLFFPSIVADLREAWAKQPNMEQGAKAATVAISLAAGTVINTLVIAASTVLLRLATYLLGGTARFSDLLGNVIVANTPLILERAARAVLYYVGIELEGWRDRVALGSLTGFTDDTGWWQSLRFLNLFDLWFVGLLAIAVYRSTTLGLPRTLLAVTLVWGGYLLLLVRLYMLGLVA